VTDYMEDHKNNSMLFSGTYGQVQYKVEGEGCIIAAISSFV